MSYFIPNFEEIRIQMLRDIRNIDPEAQVSSDSDHYIRASATASVVEGLYDHQNWIIRQIVPDTADSEFLEVHARLRGLVRKPATRANGHVIVSGISGAILPLGTPVRDTNGALYTTTKQVILNAEEANPKEQTQVMEIVPCQADKPGVVVSCQDVLAKIMNPPLGIDENVLLSIFGGSNTESDDALLSRLLEYMRNPPGAGTALDYKRWAMEVPGVDKAYVYPLRQGLGTVDIVITGEQDILLPETVSAVQKHIDTVRPVTVHSVCVIAAVPKVINMEIALRLNQPDPTHVISAQIKEVLQKVFSQYGPGSSVVLSHLLAAITSIPGVFDTAILNPESNVMMNIVELPVLGDIVLRGL